MSRLTRHSTQFLWTVKLLPFSCRAEKWFYYARRRRSPTCYSSVSKEQYVELVQQLHATHTSRSSDQQRMIDQVRMAMVDVCCLLLFA